MKNKIITLEIINSFNLKNIDNNAFPVNSMQILLHFKLSPMRFSFILKITHGFSSYLKKILNNYVHIMK